MTAQKDQDAPRRPGRPRGKKPGTANREQLMDIALTLFARDGAGRVSLNAIAKEAGVTPAMLHYYFSSRDALVTQLIEERFMPLRNHISRIFVDHPQDPVLALTMMVETLGHMAEKNAWFAPLWMQEIIGEMPILRQHMDARFGEERFQVMLGTVRRWQQEGKINPALAPELLFTTVISLVLVPFSRIHSDPRLQAVNRQTIISHALALMATGRRLRRGFDAFVARIRHHAPPSGIFPARTALSRATTPMLCPGRLRSRYFFCVMSLMAQGAHSTNRRPGKATAATRQEYRCRA